MGFELNKDEDNKSKGSGFDLNKDEKFLKSFGQSIASNIDHED